MNMKVREDNGMWEVDVLLMKPQVRIVGGRLRRRPHSRAQKRPGEMRSNKLIQT